MFSLAQFFERRKREREEKKKAALAAYSGLHKLIFSLNSIEGLARHIELQYRSAGNGVSERNPSSVVQDIVGHRAEPMPLAPEELLFLAPGDGELMASIHEIQERAVVLGAVVSQYNEMRRDFRDFSEKHAEIGEVQDGLLVSTKFSDRHARIAELKVGSMNRLLGDLIEYLERDKKQINQVIQQYVEKAKSHFGAAFPVKTVERR